VLDLPFNIGLASESGIYVLYVKPARLGLRSMFGFQVLPADLPDEVLRRLLRPKG